MKTLESETVWKDGKLVTMYKQDLGGIFAGQESWYSQDLLDYIQRLKRQEKELRERRAAKKVREQYPYGKSSFVV